MLMLEMVPPIHADYHVRYDIIFRQKLWRAPYHLFVTQCMIKSIGNHIISASLRLLEVSSGLEFYYL